MEVSVTVRAITSIVYGNKNIRREVEVSTESQEEMDATARAIYQAALEAGVLDRVAKMEADRQERLG